MLLRNLFISAFILAGLLEASSQDCLPSLLREGDRLRQLKDYQQALYRYKAALTCEEIDLPKFKEVYRRIETTEKEYENMLLHEREQLRRQRKAAELAMEAIRIKDSDPGLALQLLQTACELSDNSNPLAVALRKELLSNPQLQLTGQLLDGRQVKAAAFSPNGRYLVTGGSAADGSVSVYDMDNPDYPVHGDGSLGHIVALAFIPNQEGAIVVVNTQGHVYRCDNLATLEFDIVKSLGVMPTALAVSPDGLTAVVGDMNGQVHLVSLVKIQFFSLRITQNEGEPEKIEKQAMSLRASNDGGAVIIENEQTAYASYDVLPLGAVRSIAINNKEQILVCTGQKAWMGKLNDDRYRKDISGYDGYVRTACFTPDGVYFLLGVHSGAIYVYASKSLSSPLVGTMAYNKAVNKLEVASASNNLLCATNDGVYLWQINYDVIARGNRDFSWNSGIITLTRRLPGYLSGDIGAMAISGNGNVVLTTSDSEFPRLFDLSEQSLSGEASLVTQSATIVSFTMDKNKLWLASAELGGKVYLYNILNNKDYEARVPGGQVEHLVFAGEMLYMANTRGEIYRWNAMMNNPQFFAGYYGGISLLSASPDGRYVAVVGKNDIRLSIYNEIGKMVGQPFSPRQSKITAIDFFPSGDSLIIGKENGELGILTTRSVQNGHEVMGSFHIGPVKTILTSPDSLHFLSMGGRTVIIWPLGGDFSQGINAIKSFQVDEEVSAVSFSSNGKYLATASPYSIDIWPINRMEESNLSVFSIPPQGAEMKQIWYSLDDKRVLAFEGESVYSYTNALAVFEQEHANALPVALKIQYKLANVQDCLDSEDPEQVWECIQYFAVEYDDALNEREKHLENLIAIYEKYETMTLDGEGSYIYSQLCWAYTEKANYVFERSNADSSVICLKKAAAFGEKSRTVKDTRNIRDRLSNTYTNLSWYAVLAGKYEAALNYADKSLALEPAGVACKGMAITNKALAYLLQGKTKLAFAIYDQYQFNSCTDVKGYQSFRDAFLTDLIQLEEMGVSRDKTRLVSTYIKKAQDYLMKGVSAR